MVSSKIRARLAALAGLALAVTIAGAAGGTAVANAEHLRSSDGIDGQVYNVSLATPQIAGSSPVAAGAACSAMQVQAAGFDRLTFQFGLSMQNASPRLSIVSSDSQSPGDVSKTVPLTGSGLQFSFSDPLTAGVATFTSGDLRFTTPAGSTAPNALTVSVKGTLFIATGDVIVASGCTFSTTGSGTLDTMPVMVSFAKNCGDANGAVAPCWLLADGGFRVVLSKPVDLAALAAALSAVDDTGEPVMLAPSPAPSGFATELLVRGAWPLGHDIVVTVASGITDRSGNRTSDPVVQRFTVVADPGDLDAANNSGFETGDLSGYTVNALAQYQQNGPADFDEALYLAHSPSDINTVASAITAVHGVQPTEGQYMAALSPSGSCDAGEAALTARFVVPGGVSTLVLDYDLVAKGRAGGGAPLLVGSLVAGLDLRTAKVPQPAQASLMPAADGYFQTGWQQFSLPVDGLAGQTVILTLRGRGSQAVGPPPACFGGTLLIDNLRFN